MNKIESNNCVAMMLRVFPKSELVEEEIKLFGDALLPFAESDVMEVIRQHRLTSSLHRPKFDAILSQCWAMRRKNACQDGPIWPTHGQILAKSMNCQPVEAILRHWRAQWVQYASGAVRRERFFKSLPSGPLRESAKLTWQQNRDGCKRRCLISATGGLIAEGVTHKAAADWAQSIFAAPGDFQLVLNDLRTNGIDRVPESNDDSSPHDGSATFADPILVPDFSH